MNTGSFPKTTSKAFPLSLSDVLEVLLLTLIGAAGVLLHARFRMPLHMPGHWGLVYMTLIMAGRLMSGKPYACSLSGLGAAAMLLFPLGFRDPFMPLIYLLPGIVTDFSWYFVRRLSIGKWLMIVFGGLAYATIPLSRLVIMEFTGIPYGSLVTGIGFPLFTHFIFGATGSLAGLGFAGMLKRLFKI